jgi:tetratricopeptide (TPR) repeat protein
MQQVHAFSAAKVADRYTLLSVLGSGGMAKVYAATDDSRGGTIALKRLTSADSVAAAHFEAEFRTLAGLEHPSIIEVYDYGVDDEGPYYTMELLDGGDVASAAPLPWRVVCQCLRDVGSALTLVHRRELVHRDISPRNVWRTADGSFKVIDFGAMTRFGIPNAVVGTPGFMAPESVMGAELDHRTDLYSLGAVAYFLLTGRRASGARTLEDVASPAPKPPPASALCPAAGEDAIPPDLDELVLSMLSRNPLARPSSAAEVIERACAIAGLAPETQSGSAAPQQVSTHFVGRDAEARLLGDAVARLSQNTGAAILVEAAAGLGKSRLLAEAKLAAGLDGVTVLFAEARLFPRFNGVAIHLAKSLLEAQPELGRRLAAPHAAALSQLSPVIRDLLDYSGPAPTHAAPGEVRMRIQDALAGWFRAVSEQEKLAVFVDDADELDDASGAFVSALARSSTESAVLVVASSTESAGKTDSDTMKVVRATSVGVHLEAMHLDVTRALLRSAFGDVPNLPRLAERLHERSEGNPQRCLDLVLHLVRQDVIEYQGGTWILPIELPDDRLPKTFDAVLARRFDQLSSVARSVAQILGLQRGPLSVETLTALFDGDQAGRVSLAVDELLRDGVASGNRNAVRLADRYAAHVGAMAPERIAVVHGKLAEGILSRGQLSAIDRLEAGFHLVQAGDLDRGGKLLARAGIDLTSEADNIPAALPTLQAALEVYRKLGRPPSELAPLLAPIASGAYYADHRLAGRYGDEALSVMQSLVGLDIANRLRRFLGRRLSVIVGIAVAALRLRRQSKKGRVPDIREAFILLFATVATLTGVKVIYVDHVTALKHAMVIEPLTVLGKNHVATFMYEFTRSLVMTIENASGQARERWKRLLAWLRSDRPIEGFPGNRRGLYEGGALYALGVLESWADGPRALQIAEELDATGMKLYEMSADQLRALHYANQGIAERFQHFRQRVETHAIRRGTAWQVEIWWHAALISTHFRSHDAMGMKHARDVLERLTREIPSLHSVAQRARGAYEVMRGRHDKAIEILEEARRADSTLVGTHRLTGLLARAYSLAGDPAKARELCLSALKQMDGGDSELVSMNQVVSIELALSEARLGNHAEAERQLDALLQQHIPLQGPLTLGNLYEARGTVAMLRNELDDARDCFRQMASWYEKTGMTSLAARSEMLLANLDRTTLADVRNNAPEIVGDDSETVIFRDP